MKNFLLFALLGFGILLGVVLISCNKYIIYNKYIMPYEPGVYVDEVKFNEKKALWEQNKPLNYSYFYTCDYPAMPGECKVKVTVTNGVPEYTFIKIYGHNEGELSLEEWQSLSLMLSESIDCSIDALYSNIETTISDCKSRSAGDKTNCYYANIDIDFNNNIPFVSGYSFFECIMKPELNDGNGVAKVLITDFKID